MNGMSLKTAIRNCGDIKVVVYVGNQQHLVKVSRADARQVLATWLKKRTDGDSWHDKAGTMVALLDGQELIIGA